MAEDFISDSDWETSAADFIPEGEWDAAPQRPSWGEAAQQSGKNVLTGIGAITDLVNTVSPSNVGNLIASKLFGVDRTPQPSLRHEIDKAIPETVGGYAADLIKAGQEAATFPMGGPVANLAAGVAGEAAAKEFPENETAARLIASILPGAAATTAKNVGKGAIKQGKAFTAYGVTGGKQKPFIKSLKDSGLTKSSTGRVASHMDESIQRVVKEEGLGVNMSGEALANKITDKTNSLGEQIGKMAKKADDAAFKPIEPEFENVKTLLQSKGGVKKDIKDQFDDFISRFNDPETGWDGTVQGLHKWSKDIRLMGYAGAASGQTKDAVVKQFQRAVGRDLQDALKKNLTKAGIPQEEIKGTFRRFSNLATVRDVVQERFAAESVKTIGTTVRDLARTSGGAASGVLAGIAAGTPGLGLLYGATLASMLSPTGAGLWGRLFKGGGGAADATLGKLFKGASLGKTAKGAAAATLMGDSGEGEDVPEENFTPMEQPQEEDPMLLINQLIGDTASDKKKTETMTEKPASKRAEMEALAESVAEQVGLDPVVFKSLAIQESGWNPKAKSDKGALGLAQLMPKTAREVARKLGLDTYDLKDPATNLLFGATYLKEQLDKFGDMELALTAYHSGPHTVDRLLRATKGSTLDDIIKGLGPVGRQYARSILGRVEKGNV